MSPFEHVACVLVPSRDRALSCRIFMFISKIFDVRMSINLPTNNNWDLKISLKFFHCFSSLDFDLKSTIANKLDFLLFL